MNRIDIDFYNKNGYLIVPGILPTGVLRKLLTECYDVFYHQADNHKCLDSKGKVVTGDQSLFELFKRDPQAVFNCGKAIQWLPLLHKIGLNDNIFEILNRLGMKKPSISTRPVLFFHHKNIAKEEINYKTPPHRDFFSVQGSLNAIVAWFPIASIKEDMGMIEVIPGSHQRPCKFGRWSSSFGMEDSSNYKESEFVPVKMNLGDVLIFSQLLIHRSGDNTSDSIRWAANTRYTDLLCEDWIRRSYANPYVYKSVVKDLYIPS